MKSWSIQSSSFVCAALLAAAAAPLRAVLRQRLALDVDRVRERHHHVRWA
jgi:hypothetical protein